MIFGWFLLLSNQKVEEEEEIWNGWSFSPIDAEKKKKSIELLTYYGKKKTTEWVSSKAIALRRTDMF